MYSVLPPPPSVRYPPNIPQADTHNSLSKPQDQDRHLQLGEGTWVLRDEIQLGQIPHHPTEGPTLATHVLDTKRLPPTAGVKLSLAVIAPRKTSPRLRQIPTSSGNSSVSSNLIGTAGDSTTNSGSETGTSNSNILTNLASPTFKSWRFGDNNNALSAAGKADKDGKQRKKPKNSIAKSNSSFISRVIPSEMALKKLDQRDPAGLFAFVNTSRAFLWLDMAAERKQDQLMKILFTRAHALCHNVNESTKAAFHLDVLIGSNQGDILWYEPFSQRYWRMNKNAANASINKHAVADIKWLPHSDNLFMAAHHDGSLIIYDKFREDGDFKPEAPPPPSLSSSTTSAKKPRMLVLKSSHSKAQSQNPVAVYKISNQCINSLAFSPTGRHLATVSEDGALRVIDMETEQLVDLHTSYYGGINCVTWSPDGQYLLTGGHDDLVSLWSLADRTLVARGVGHKSWVTAVAFDPYRCDDEGNYRFASVGEDCRLLVWDFAPSMLSRPRSASIRHSVSSYVPSRTQSAATVQRIADVDSDDEIAHEVVPRGAAPMLPPVLAKTCDATPLTWVGFEQDALYVTSKGGRIKTFVRPTDNVSGNGYLHQNGFI